MATTSRAHAARRWWHLLIALTVVAGGQIVLQGVAEADCSWGSRGCSIVSGMLPPQYLVASGRGWWEDTGATVSTQERRAGKEYRLRWCIKDGNGCEQGKPNSCGPWGGPAFGSVWFLYSRPLNSTVDYRGQQWICVRNPAPPPVTAADVRKVVQSRQPQIQLVVNGSPLQVEPRTRRALGRKPVIFYLGQSPVVQPFTVTIRTYRVRVEPYAWRYVWNFDGCAATTTIDVGRGYPDQDDAHMCLYNSFGTVHPYVTVQWRARFRVNNGRVQEAYAGNASLPIDGPRQNLTLVHQHSVLVGGG